MGRALALPATLLAATLLSACATTADRAVEVRHAVAAGRMEQALRLTTRWSARDDDPLAALERGALLGVLFRVFWTGAPRWLYTPIYIGLGWFAVFFIPDFVEGAGRLSTATAVLVVVLLVVGGLF